MFTRKRGALHSDTFSCRKMMMVQCVEWAQKKSNSNTAANEQSRREW